MENRQGTLQKVLDLLKEGNIQLIASTIADPTVRHIPHHLFRAHTRIRNPEECRHLGEPL